MAESQSGDELAQLATGLAEGMDVLRQNAQFLTNKVKEGNCETKDGISYLEVKHLLLLNYCKHLLFVILMRIKGEPLPGHPVLERLAEIRMFLEKIRPIDKKLNYQIEKLLKQATSGTDANSSLPAVKDDLKFKPNPDMLVSKIDEDEEHGGVYKPPKLVPAMMEEEETARERRARQRTERHTLRKASRSSYMKDMVNDLEGRPEEIQEVIGTDSKEFQREVARLEARSRVEEDMFARVPLSRDERKRLNRMKRARSGLAGMMDDFNDDIGGLADMEADDNRASTGEAKKKKKSKIPRKALRLKKSKGGKFKRKGKR